jgi:hypothetical protein
MDTALKTHPESIAPMLAAIPDEREYLAGLFPQCPGCPFYNGPDEGKLPICGLTRDDWADCPHVIWEMDQVGFSPNPTNTSPLATRPDSGRLPICGLTRYEIQR